MNWLKRLGLILIVAAIALAVTSAAQMPWLTRLTAALGCGAIAAAAGNFQVIDMEKLAGYEAVSTTGLRPSIAMMAGAFRADQLTGQTRTRLRAAVRDHLRRHPDSQLHTGAASLAEQALAADRPLATASARQLLDIISQEGTHHGN